MGRRKSYDSVRHECRPPTHQLTSEGWARWAAEREQEAPAGDTAGRALVAPACWRNEHEPS